LQISLQLWWRGNQWRKFVQLGPHKTIEINTFVSDKWRATDVETNKVFVINDKKKYRPKANTRVTRAVCIIKQKGLKIICFIFSIISNHSIPKVVGSIPTVAGHIFQARPVWIYTQSNITNIILNPIHPRI
jgi:hypothetical protein